MVGGDGEGVGVIGGVDYVAGGAAAIGPHHVTFLLCVAVPLHAHVALLSLRPPFV